MKSYASSLWMKQFFALCFFFPPWGGHAIAQGSEIEPPFTFSMPPGRVSGLVDVHFGQVEVGSVNQETRFAVVNMSSNPVEILVTSMPEGISVSPNQFTLPAGAGNQVAITVTWQPQVAMALNSDLVFESVVNEVNTGNRSWGLTGFAGIFHLSQNGTRIDELDFGAVALGQSVAEDLTLINHTDQALPLSVLNPNTQLQINLASATLPSSGSLDLTVTYTPTASTLQETVQFQTTGFNLPIPMAGTGVTAPWLSVTDLQGNALNAHDFGEFTANAESVSFELVVTNVGNAPTSSSAALAGFDYQSSSISCSQEGLNLCAINAATGLGPHIRNMAPGESRTLRFLAQPEIVGEFEKTIRFETANQSLPLQIQGDAVPFLLPRWSPSTGETSSSPSNGDYLTNPMGPKLANGLGQAQVFQANDIDNINLFNGNLMLQIPIGPSYPAGGNLAYGLQLAYNANAWDVRYKEEFQGSPAREVTTSVVSPDPKSNAGLGFTLHMGRLFAPSNLDYYRSLSQTEQEKYPLSRNWTYIAPDNSSHTFHSLLHSPGTQGSDPDVLYTSDSTYLRLVDKGTVNGFFTKEVHFPNGVVHVFQYRTHWGDTWIDVWRLVEIRDPYQNFVRVAYQNMAWTLTDTYGRQQRIDFEADPYWSMRVREVSLTAFDQTTARYRFDYETVSLNRPFDTFNGHSTHVTVSRLKTITLPDSTTYDFAYGQELGTRIAEVTLPTDATLAWDYEQFFFPYPEQCDSEESVPFPWQFRVAERRVQDQYGALLDQKQFRIGTSQGSSIPDTYCHQYFPTPSFNVPEAEMVTYVFSPTGPDQGRLDLNYFSIWPFAHDLHTGARVSGGWHSSEYGQNFTRNHPDPQDPTRFLSHQVYQMPHGDMPSTGFIGWINSGQLLRSTYITKDLGLAYNSFAGAGRSSNGRIRKSSTIFHDDNNRRTYVEYDRFDGLGHFRRKRTFGNIGDDGFTYITDYHPWRGELTLDDNGLPSPASTFVLPTKNEPWLLNTFVKKTVQDNQGQTHGSSFLFNLNKGHLLKERIWKTGTFDGANDVVRVHSYDSKGHLVATRLYGGDTQTLPTGNGLDHNFHTESSPQGHQYKTINTYQYGVLKTAQMEGFSHYTSHHPQIDFHTGLVKVSTDASGTLATTHHYDTMGRLVRVTSSEDANRVFNFKLPGVNGWNKPPKLVALDYRNGTLSGSQNLLKKQVIYFDNLGRVIREDASHPDGFMMRYDLNYNQRGWIVKETVTQAHHQFDPNKAKQFEYDALGQVVRVTQPDGSQTTQTFRGIRQIDITNRVGSHLDGSGGITQSSSLTRLFRNRQGQIISVETPAHTTNFEYNALGALIQAARGNQIRNYTVDGRGFTTAEQLPEKGINGNGFVTFSDIDPLGNVGLKSDGAYQTAFTFDGAGRMVGMFDAMTGDPILEKTYSTTPGITNGRIVTATRYNQVTPENTGGAVAQADTRVVTEQYVIGRDGRLERRDSTVTTGSGLEVASFTQGWTYNDLGLIASLQYPECTTANCWSPSTQVDFDYDQGFLTNVSQGSWTGASFTYRQDGQLEDVIHANGLVDSYLPASHGMSRPEMIRLASGHLPLGPYRYDDSGNITNIGGDVYLYDLNSRLVRGDIQGGIQGDHRLYSYDAFDNLVRKGPDVLAPNPQNNRLPDATYDAAGQTTQIGAFAMSYDAFGLMESMVHNPQQSNAPCNLSTPDGDCWIYWYGPDNRRIGGLSLLADGSGDYFWTIRDQDGKVLRSFKSLTQTLEATEDHFYGTSGAFATKDLMNGQEKHLHNDHLGTARGASDAFGNFLGTRHRTPFGSPTGTDGVVEPIQDWTGHERDPNDRTYYMKARTYFDGWGRFFTADPARAGWNLYTYAANNPINMVDPTGLAETRGNSGRASNGKECHDHPYLCEQEVVPVIPEPEEGSTYTIIPKVEKGPVDGGGGFFVETNETNQISNVGYAFEGTISAEIELPLTPGANDSTEVTINETSVEIMKGPFGAVVEKTNKIHPVTETDLQAYAETPVGTAIVDQDGARVDPNISNKTIKIGIRASIRVKFGFRQAYNYVANGINAGYEWAQTCGGLCTFRE